MSLLVDIWQQGKIRDANEAATSAGAVAQTARERTHDLERRVEALALANQALFEILAERLGLSETDVVQRMVEIDARDGRNDGRMGGQPVKCRKCHRTTNTAQKTCMYCGTPVIDGHLFQKI